MSESFFEDQIFEAIDCSTKGLPKGDYEACTFINCNFSNCDLSHFKFTDCDFKSCNLSMVKLIKTSFNSIKFIDCKMLGVSFDNCDEYLFSFEMQGCTLDFTTYYKRKLKKTIFRNCSLQDADFTNADLTEATFDNCNLLRAKFENTILEKADLRTAYNYSINPEINKIKKARFSFPGIAGLLEKYDIKIE